MPWYGWVLLAIGAVIALAAITLRALRASHRGRDFLALSTRGKLRFGRELLGDPEVPFVAKPILLVLVGYLALPFDLIPDFIPVLGQADDFLVIVLAMSLLILAIPRGRFERALAVARHAEDARRTAPAEAVPPPRR